MRLLLDQGLPRSSARLLSGAGHDTVHIGELGLATAQDSEILARAAAEQRAVVTLDADFHALLAHAQATAPSVIRVRIEGLDGRALAELLDRVVSWCADDLQAGAAITVEPARIRVRRLPLARRRLGPQGSR